ncbi:hypothetical protein FP203_19720 [Salmonella enterica]|uniref:Uncharacterized protein n=1 Tax=Salmonella montevideo TaxID=115981 RepID=A0A5U1W8Q5_SALMO|nr:hypothetical protein [Salmonella enterica]EBL4697491.1 hypothetical protein [Salmonella enterica subsp. enterica serovar Montevideo]ECH6932468.1 hypothetical protein [Salmonella enterica subsp. enterica serovar Cerro]EEG5744430.1 hypothetical protein [Salmonella enterica subsp. enterica]EBA6333240.1 hypothetical protein [Salmonella enterica]
MALTGGNLFSANVLIIVFCSFDNNHPCNPQVSTVWRHWHCCKVSDEAAFCLIQRPYISKTLLTRRISPRGSP